MMPAPSSTSELNPFANRREIVEPKEFYGRRQPLEEILNQLAFEKPLSVSVFGERRIGKSSLLNFLMHPQGARKRYDKYDKIFANLLFVRMDLIAFEPGKVDKDSLQIQFFGGMIRQMHNAIRRWYGETSDHKVPENLEFIFKKSESMDSTFKLVNACIQPYLEELSLVNKKLALVLLIDRADNLIETEVGNSLRMLITNPDTRISLILFTNRRIVDLDPKGLSSPLYNALSAEIPLGRLKDEEALELLKKTISGSGKEFTEAQKRWIIRLSGGHPEFLKVAAKNVFKALPKGSAEIDLDGLLPDIRKDLEITCRSLWTSLNEHKTKTGFNPVVPVLQALLNGTQPGDAGMVNELLERGVLCQEGADLSIFSPIFAEYARHELEHEESQPAAVIVSPPPQVPAAIEELAITSKQLTFGAVVVPLTGREAGVLQFMNDKRGRPCSREDLFITVWDRPLSDDDPAVGENNIAALNIVIQRLRKKLAEHHLEERIRLQSERGQGYSLTIR
jgi:DNA-binding winged helix-turn-helix (wHTH) protein